MAALINDTMYLLKEDDSQNDQNTPVTHLSVHPSNGEITSIMGSKSTLTYSEEESPKKSRGHYSSL